MIHVARARGAWDRGDQRWDGDGKTNLKIDLNNGRVLGLPVKNMGLSVKYTDKQIHVGHIYNSALEIVHMKFHFNWVSSVCIGYTWQPYLI